MYTVYILYSNTTQKYYTGQSQDLANRILEHNSGETKSLKGGIPWDLLWQTEVENRALAMALEKKIKNIGARRFLAKHNDSSDR